MLDVLMVLFAYCLGSVPFGLLMVKWAKGIDVRTQGSGNIGMTNVWRVAGAGWGIATFILDISKGVLSVWLASHFDPGDELLRVVCGLAALLGNVFSVFLKFQGGKGIGVSTGVFFSLLPLESTFGLVFFIVALLWGRMVSLASLTGATVMMILTLYHQGITWDSALAVTAACTIWWTHRENLRRIRGGNEKKINFKIK